VVAVASKGKAEPRPSLPPHAFDRDPEVPPDFFGRATCRCGKVGKDGDEQHPLGALPLPPTFPQQPAEVSEYEARKLGEVA
jgi:hypothetical protein